VRFFNFQDDDFAAKTQEQRQWLSQFLDAMFAAGLSERVVWKIACRVDDVSIETMRECQKHGLAGVYLGVESGNSTGLRTLNKHVTVQQNAAAIQTLKTLHIPFEIGFMLFDPSSTVDTVAQNIRFLQEHMSDGKAPVNFCKMLPYAGTPIEAELKYEGRLRGTISQPDYAFLDPRLDLYAHFVHQTFQNRNFKYSGLVERLCTALFDVVLMQMTEEAPLTRDYERQLQRITRRVNRVALDTLEASLADVAERDFFQVLNGWGYLKELMKWELEQETLLEGELAKVLARFNP
jgi:anaerobic magnesium-protoporphyrin IX monomethyl ester cyclase